GLTPRGGGGPRVWDPAGGRPLSAPRGPSGGALSGAGGGGGAPPRGDLGMMREGEVFVHVLPPGTPLPSANAIPQATAPKPPPKPGVAGAATTQRR
ncbi:hypothetical protein LWS69_28015, partial [Bordetella hinzii]|nr:hypothetical protein [Bordetella hinzii]